ncbi:MAG: CAP domain-containing protein [Polyangiaceae bacterium]
MRLRPETALNRLFFSLVASSACVLATCKKEDPPASYPVPIGTPVTAVVPPGGGATTAGPAASTPVSGAPAVGMPCGSDQDLQCPFSHCVANRCGGCTSAAACKPGSQCLPTWLGYACFPGSAPATVPVPVPVPVPASASSSSDPLEALRARCVQRTNEFRASVTPGPLVRQAAHEACADAEAQSDGATSTAHGAFGRCQEAGQNECPGWPGPLDQMIDKCLAQMFAEGPGSFSGGHGHYLNIVDPTFHGVSCGFSTAPNGKIWLVQDFYR